MKQLDECQWKILAQASRFTIGIVNITFVCFLIYSLFNRKSAAFHQTDVWFIFIISNIVRSLSDLYYRNKYSMDSTQLIHDESSIFLAQKIATVNILYLIITLLGALIIEIWLQEPIQYTVFFLVVLFLLEISLILYFAWKYGYFPSRHSQE